MKKALALFLTLVTVLSLTALAAVSSFAADGIPKADNAIFVADSGDDNAAGTTPDAPVASLKAAFGKLPNGGVIVIVGVVTITSENNIMPAHSGVITITSYYDGVDYRSKPYGTEPVTPRLNLCNATKQLDIFGDTVIDYLRINSGINEAGGIICDSIIAFNYHNVTIGANIENTFEDAKGVPSDFDLDYSANGNKGNNGRRTVPIIIFGNNSNGNDESPKAGGETITGEYTVNIAGGAWHSLRIGDRDIQNRNTLDCRVTVNITGGTFTGWTGIFKNYGMDVMGVSQAGTTPNYVCDITITGGTFYGEVVGFGSPGGVAVGDGIQQGTVNMNILGGKWIRDYQGNGPMVFAASTASVPYDGAKFNLKVDPSKLEFGTVEQMSLAGLDGVTSTLEMVTESDKLGFFGLDFYFDETYLPLIEKAPVETQATETKPAETKPAETKPADTKPAETKPADTKAVDTKPASTEATGTKPAGETAAKGGIPAYVWAIVGVVVVAAIVAAVLAAKKKKN